MTNKWRNLAIALIVVLAIGVGIVAGCATSTPPTEPKEQHSIGSGTLYIRPNDAEGTNIRMDIAGTVYGKFTNNVPYSVEMYVVPESASGQRYTEIHEMFKDNIYSSSGVSKDFSFRLPPGGTHVIWFYNRTSNVEFEVKYELYWKPD